MGRLGSSIRLQSGEDPIRRRRLGLAGGQTQLDLVKVIMDIQGKEAEREKN